MPTGPDAAASSARELTITRLLLAPRQLVWRAWTEPSHLVRWWGPHGFTASVCELDLRPGGAIRIEMQAPDGTVVPVGAIFHQIDAPERLVFTTTVFPDQDGNPRIEVLNTLTLAEQLDGTLLTLRLRVIKSSPELAAALAGQEAGWSQSLARLAEHLANP
jgi:uncharacterized protein YndB with AHSA1/START domain